jgi:hypothetical protein
MIKNKIELGNFDRAGPIILKEKIGEDGAITTRIYQRKDIQSIENLITRIKNTVKYSIEDFFIEYKKFQPILRLIGLKKINKPDFGAIKNSSELFKNLKSGKIDAFTDIDSILNLNKFLNSNNIDSKSINQLLIDRCENKEFIKYLSNEHKEMATDIQINLALEFFSGNHETKNLYEKEDNSLELYYEELTSFINKWPEDQLDEIVKKQFFKDKLFSVYENMAFKWMTGVKTKGQLLEACKGSNEIAKELNRVFSNSESISRDEKREALKSAEEYLLKNKLEVPFGLKCWASSLLLSADVSIIRYS